MIRTVRKLPRSGHKGGGHACSTCDHPEREAIEAALAARTPSLAVLEGKYGIDHSSLSRHRSNHMSKALIAIRPALPADASRVERLEAQAARLEARAAEADRAGHTDQLTSISRELRITYADIAKAKGESNGPPPVGVNIQTSAEWHAIRAIIWEVLEPHPALRQAIGKRLIALDGKSK